MHGTTKQYNTRQSNVMQCNAMEKNNEARIVIQPYIEIGLSATDIHMTTEYIFVWD